MENLAQDICDDLKRLAGVSQLTRRPYCDVTLFMIVDLLVDRLLEHGIAPDVVRAMLVKRDG